MDWTRFLHAFRLGMKENTLQRSGFSERLRVGPHREELPRKRMEKEEQEERKDRGKRSREFESRYYDINYVLLPDRDDSENLWRTVSVQKSKVGGPLIL